MFVVVVYALNSVKIQFKDINYVAFKIEFFILLKIPVYIFRVNFSTRNNWVKHESEYYLESKFVWNVSIEWRKQFVMV